MRRQITTFPPSSRSLIFSCRPSTKLLWNGPDQAKCRVCLVNDKRCDMTKNLTSVVCVAGAGRGPLVARCLSAVNRSKRNVHIYAIEKNPNAFVTYGSFFVLSRCLFNIDILVQVAKSPAHRMEGPSPTIIWRHANHRSS